MMEPMTVAEGSPHRGPLTDLAVELAVRAAGFRSSVQEPLRAALADLVRSMNCYYSNLIEGHDTHPVDIERALRSDYSSDRRKRDLQLEARAHIEVQRWIDGGGVRRRAASADAVREIHQRFCAHLPEELLRVEEPATAERLSVTPGEWRGRDVNVGRHVPVSPGAVPRFLARFETSYGGLGRADSILATAAAHHRLLWIHPFLDGNGRVARLMSHAMLLDALDTGGVWSVARGMARSVEAYKAHLADCDLPRRNDLDGRGSLSEESLARFTGFFLGACIDQVAFMESLIEPERLRTRILLWAEEEVRMGKLPAKAATVLVAMLLQGQLPRAEIAGLLDSTERHARRVVAALVKQEVIASAGPRAPWRLAFPASLAGRWLPGLFPERSRAS